MVIRGFNFRKPTDREILPDISPVKPKNTGFSLQIDRLDGINVLKHLVSEAQRLTIPSENLCLVVWRSKKEMSFSPVDNQFKENKSRKGFLCYVMGFKELGSSINPQDIYLEEIDSNKLKTAFTTTKEPTKDQKASTKSQITQATLTCPLVAPKYDGMNSPEYMDMVKVTYVDQHESSGDVIQGYYELVSTSDKFKQGVKDYLNFIGQQVDKLSSIFNDSDSEVPEGVQYNENLPINPNLDVGTTKLNQGAYRDIIGFNGNKTISAIGCCLTSYTMAANLLLNKNLTPVQSNELGKAANPSGFLNQIVVHQNLSRALGLTPVKTEDDTRPTLGIGNIDGIRTFTNNTLERGGVVLFHVNWRGDPSGDHWILCTKKYDDKTYLCADPAGGVSVLIDIGNLKGTQPRNKATYNVVRAIRVFKP